jgi:hypothetical protein
VVEGGAPGIDLLGQSVAVLREAPAPLELARALIDLGSALRRRGSRAQARELLREGLDIAHGRGGTALADKARDELVIAGGRPRRDALRGRDALTPSELRVAQMAADRAGPFCDPADRREPPDQQLRQARDQLASRGRHRARGQLAPAGLVRPPSARRRSPGCRR